MTADDPNIADPPNAVRVDGWEHIDGRHERYFGCREHGGTGLDIHVAGMQQADGTYREIHIVAGDCELDIDDVDAVIGDLMAARAEARALMPR